jgi:hypothetical protein
LVIAPNPLRRALEAQQHAEELQRQRQPQSIEQYIDRLPDLSGHKRSFLKRHPALLDPAVAPIMARVYHAGLQSGLQDDTAELDQFVLDNVAREIGHHRELTSADARPTPENQQAHQDVAEAVQDLESEAEAILAETTAAQQPPPVAPRRSIPVLAPVSREPR